MAQELKFSDQAIGALMMALQKCILHQTDITDILRNYKLKNSEIGLMILNPAVVKFDYSDDDELVGDHCDTASD